MAKSLKDQRAAFVKKAGRQSKNIVDLRDIEVGPKKTKVQTKAFKKDNTLGKMAGDRQMRILQSGYDRMIDKGSIRDNSDDFPTLMGNVMVNDARTKQGAEVGSAVKNMKLKTSGKFAKFFKHTIKDNK